MFMTAQTNSPLFSPDTPENRTLRAQVTPPDWVNPPPAARYNLVVIGAGSGGLVTAAGAAGLGAKVALIEKHALGGDCLNVGCVPSKALLSAAKAAAAARNGSVCGVDTQGVAVDFPAVMNRMRALRAKIAPHDSAERFRDLGIDVFLSEGKFTDGGTVEVRGAELKFSKAVIATGARAVILPIPGLQEAGALTNETLFSLTELPKRLAVIGAGPIGCEMAQAFARFGSRVTLFETECKILPREDQDAAEVVRNALHRDGVNSLCGVNIEWVESDGGQKTIHYACGADKKSLEVDHILIGVGRAPNVEGIGLEAAGVDYDVRKGVTVNERLQTTNKRIYAVGDVCMAFKFTHVADFSARLVLQNALFGGRKKHTGLLVPWCTYTQPEIAHVGLYEDEAESKHGPDLKTFRRDFADVDRTLLEGHTEGFVKIHTAKGKIIGATIVGEHAGDMISEISVAMRAGMGLGTLASVIHPYPTAAEAIRQCGDAYNCEKLTPTVAMLFSWWLRKTL